LKGFTKGKGKGRKFIPTTNRKKGLKKSDLMKKESLDGHESKWRKNLPERVKQIAKMNDAVGKHVDKDIAIREEYESQQLEKNPNYLKEKEEDWNSHMDDYDIRQKTMKENFDRYVSEHLDDRIVLSPLSDSRKEIVLRFVEDDLMVDDKDFWENNNEQDLIDAKTKIINNDYSFTIKEANALQTSVAVNRMLLEDNPKYTEDEVDTIGFALGEVEMGFWDQRHMWATGFIKYNDAEEVKQSDIAESKSFGKNFLGFDKYQRMTFKGGNPPVWDAYGKHLETGKDIRDNS